MSQLEGKQEHRKKFLAILDQSVVAGANFLVVALLGRWLPGTEFSVYLVLLAVLNLVLGIHAATVTYPLAVFGSRVFDEEVERYLRGSAILQIVLSMLALLIPFFLLFIISDEYLLVLIAAFLILQFPYQSNDFARRLLIARHRYNVLFLFDICSSGLKIGSLIVLSELGVQDILPYVIALAAAYLLAFLVIVNKIPSSALKFGGISEEYSIVKSIWKKNWTISKFTLVEIIFYNLTTQLYLFACAALLHKNEVAAFGVFTSISNVINIYLVGLTNYGLSDISRSRYQRDWGRWKSGVVSVANICLGLSGIIALIVFFSPHQLLRLIFGDSYLLGFSDHLRLFSLVVLLRTLNVVGMMALRSLEMQNLITWATLISGGVTVVIVYPFLAYFSLNGAVAGLAISQAVLTVSLAHSMIVHRDKIRFRVEASVS